MKRLICLGVLFTSFSANAALITHDFEQFSGSVTTFESLDPVEQLLSDFTLTKGAGTVLWLTAGNGPLPQTTAVAFNFSSVTLAQSGASFDFVGLDLAFGNGAGTLLLSATKTDGSVVSLSQVFGLTSSYLNWTPAGTTFADIVNLTVSANGLVAIDNIVVSAVPVPAAVWLLGSALAALGWVGRKRQMASIKFASK